MKPLAIVNQMVHVREAVPQLVADGLAEGRHIHQIRDVEPSGASMMSDPVRSGGRRVGVVLSGGNVGADRFTALIGAAA
ncbi:hypothetical protein [Nonomuraea sp. NPDC050643]|uniref:hypothetical protein n=1 Tax=Nonomuraea sp. NPDC050643 TaxID=3155660 RepID=UPI0033FD2C82